MPGHRTNFIFGQLAGEIAAGPHSRIPHGVPGKVGKWFWIRIKSLTRSRAVRFTVGPGWPRPEIEPPRCTHPSRLRAASQQFLNSSCGSFIGGGGGGGGCGGGNGGRSVAQRRAAGSVAEERMYFALRAGISFCKWQGTVWNLSRLGT